PPASFRSRGVEVHSPPIAMKSIQTFAIADRRRHARARARVSVGLKVGGQVTMTQTRDFSVSGVFIETETVVAVGTPVEMFLVPPGRGELLRLPGSVARV